jgi:hypothetical protein
VPASKEAILKRFSVLILLGLAAAAGPAGCGGTATPSPSPPASSPAADSASATARAPTRVAATLSDRAGPSWTGRLGDTVRVDWYDQASGRAHGELVAVLAVKRLPSSDDDAPNEFGDDYGPYEWKYGVKVRLTSLDEVTAEDPVAYQFLQLSDGSRTESGVAGLGAAGGPDPSRAGRGSIGWLTLRAEQGFAPTEVVLPVGSWQAVWALD